MPVKLNSTGGGSVTLDVGSTATNFTQTLPSATGTLLIPGQASAIVSGTAVTASGTAVDFTGIPSWVKRITVLCSGVSTNGSSNLIVQLGTSGGVVTSGYLSTLGSVTTASAGTTNATNGFVFSSVNSSSTTSGTVSICTLGSNIWVFSGVTKDSTADTNLSGGDITLGGTLDRIRITAINGTDAFDAGTINILYE